MDTTVLVIIGGLVLLALLAALLLLRRSWGNFPSGGTRLPMVMQPQKSSRAVPGDGDEWDAGGQRAAAESGYAQPSTGDLVLITNPNIRRAAEQALQKGDNSAKYFARDDDKVYFNAAAISDPNERRRAALAMQRIGTDDEIDMGDVWQVIQMLRRS